MKKNILKLKNKAIDVAVEKYGAKKIDNNFVMVGDVKIDLSASGYEDWQVAKNIIDQLTN